MILVASLLATMALTKQTATSNPPQVVVNAPGVVFRNPIIKEGDKEGPADIGAVYWFNSPTTFKALEMKRALVGRYNLDRSERIGYQITGSRSPVRFRADKLPDFIVTILPLMQVPTNFEVFALDVRGPSRFIPMNPNSNSSSVQGIMGIHVRTQHYVGDCYRLIISDALPPGEYAFRYGIEIDGPKDWFCFGVDPGAKNDNPVNDKPGQR